MLLARIAGTVVATVKIHVWRGKSFSFASLVNPQGADEKG
jgi:microcompartment protein CcmK/EutM